MPEVPPLLNPPFSHEIARENYDRLARWYDLISGNSEQPYKDAGVVMLDLKPGDRVLEVGCGTGKCLANLAGKTRVSSLVLGVDLSAGMLKESGKRLKKVELRSRVPLLQADALRLPLADGCLDAVFSSFTLELFPMEEIPMVVTELGRVLRPGGRLGLVSLLAEKGWLVGAYGWVHRRFPQVIDCRPIPLMALVKAAGLAVAAKEVRMMWGLPVGIVVAEKD